MPPGKLWKGRRMHQTTFSLGDQTPRYSTTHTESFSCRRDDGRPLVFHLTDPSYPSQHRSGLVLKNISKGPSFSSTHSRDVHSPKDITPHDLLRSLRARNWTRNREGLAMKEVTNPPEDTSYRSSYGSDHCDAAAAAASGQSERASGRPTRWHRHDILTGEERPPAGPREPKKKCVEGQISAARRWENDCTSLRLY
ncbi:hypothetical protein AMELA_G00029780 [Ameiurus melas]|uniref:Uncharacterized protein n=1 Tax=Ameiurus melas TaxID=219545 RepID=A0A7J6BF53_AMEME|nr:hypothetical protein AMELA_G00029780 [Ameiurus melas]